MQYDRNKTKQNESAEGRRANGDADIRKKRRQSCAQGTLTHTLEMPIMGQNATS